MKIKNRQLFRDNSPPNFLKHLFKSLKSIIMKIIYFILTGILLSSFSCRKNSPEFFNGTVDRNINGCSASTGFVFIIKYTTQSNTEDSLSTLTLPTQFKLSGTKIKFQMRDLNSTDESMFCNAMITTPKQKVIYNVKAQ
ncbi:hypothetical protein [Hydrotalea flava]|uniref:hypothetical protein n=1 Tax=Hydrotalea flava TaxID=714549 RepID=UPI00142ED1BB|nr:hypothetical protein [Hydrotalea flava]